MDRIDLIRQEINQVLDAIPSPEVSRVASLHIYGVSQLCTLLASRRGLPVELAVIAGLLHDIYRYTAMTGKEHAHKGAGMAKKIMEDLGCFTPEEIEAVAGAIYYHSDKETRHLPLDEVLKDADVLQRVLYDPSYIMSGKEKRRMQRINEELGLRL